MFPVSYAALRASSDQDHELVPHGHGREELMVTQIKNLHCFSIPLTPKGRLGRVRPHRGWGALVTKCFTAGLSVVTEERKSPEEASGDETQMFSFLGLGPQRGLPAVGPTAPAPGAPQWLCGACLDGGARLPWRGLPLSKAPACRSGDTADKQGHGYPTNGPTAQSAPFLGLRSL